MADAATFLSKLYAANPGLQAWLKDHPERLDRLTTEAKKYASSGTYKDFANWYSGSGVSTGFTSYVAPDTTPLPEPTVDPATIEFQDSSGTSPTDTSYADALASDVRAELADFLKQWGLGDLQGFVTDAITNHLGANEIIAKLRDTPQYLAAFPENAARKENGLSWWSESQILEYRDTARRLSHEYLGIDDVTNEEIAKLVSSQVGLPEWERRLQTYKAMQQWGPFVQQALSQELGFDVSDERVFAFMNPDIPTPELDQAYQDALRRGQPAALGFGIRPEEENAILRQYGISPEQAFAGYQGVARELPRANRLAMIEAEINRSGTGFPTGGQIFGDTPFSLLFRGIQLQDPESLQKLSAILSRESARFKGQGGVATAGGVAAGLLTEEERRQLK